MSDKEDRKMSDKEDDSKMSNKEDSKSDKGDSNMSDKEDDSKMSNKEDSKSDKEDSKMSDNEDSKMSDAETCTRPVEESGEAETLNTPDTSGQVVSPSEQSQHTNEPVQDSSSTSQQGYTPPSDSNSDWNNTTTTNSEDSDSQSSSVTETPPKTLPPVPSLQKSRTVGSTASSLSGGEFESTVPGKTKVPKLKEGHTENLSVFRRMFGHSGPKDSLSALQNAQKFIDMSLEEKRKKYKCGKRYKTLDNIPTWLEDKSREDFVAEKSYYPKTKSPHSKKKKLQPVSDPKMGEKISLWRGDITTLEIDAIVNAANSSLLGGGGVDGAIHQAAGGQLRRECEAVHGGCSTGDAKRTSGYNLPAKHVIHTVGPMGINPAKLRSCYENSLQIVLDKNLKSVAFPCISTGVYGYPHGAAASTALETVVDWLAEHQDKVDRVIFCVFLEKDLEIYTELLSEYFPIVDGSSDSQDSHMESNTQSKESGSETVEPDSEHHGTPSTSVGKPV